mmetsp:Transcript_32918/g.56828  ORF Transcript_32918/g.56828 Transcript_32918/m.56828 type:complete len:181 (+) Transcript_32918:100-642(+)
MMDQFKQSFWATQPGILLIACILFDSAYILGYIPVTKFQRQIMAAGFAFYLSGRSVQSLVVAFLFPFATLFWLGKYANLLSERLIQSKSFQDAYVQRQPPNSQRQSRQGHTNFAQRAKYNNDQNSSVNAHKETSKNEEMVMGFDLDDVGAGDAEGVVELTEVSVRKRRTKHVHAPVNAAF